MDYEAVSQILGPFNNDTRRLCMEVPLIDDTFCESNPYPEDFSVVMTTTDNEVTVVPTRIGVAIDDRLDPECSELHLNYICRWFINGFIKSRALGYSVPNILRPLPGV